MHIAVLPEFSGVDPETGGDLYVLLRMEAPSPPPDSARERIPIHLALVLDRSGSMEGDKLAEAKNAATSFMKWLTRDDFLAVVAFNEDVDLIVPHQQLSDKNLVELEVQQFQAGGTTNLSGGWLRGMAELRENFTEGHIHRVVLLTDGLANRGVTEPERLCAIATKGAKKRITTTTVGFGQDFSEDVLSGAANAGGGNFHFVDQPEALADAFRTEFGDLVALVGQNVEVRIGASKGVAITDVLGDFPAQGDPNEFNARLGDLRAEELKQCIIRLNVPAGFADGEAQVGTVRVRYESVVGEMEPFDAEVPILLQFGAEAVPDDEVRHEVWMAQGIRLRVQAVEEMGSGSDLSAIASRLRRHADALEELRRVPGRLRAEQARLKELADSLENDWDDRSTLRKTMTQESFAMTRTCRILVRGAKEAEGEFGAGRPEALLDIVDRLEQRMKEEGYKSELRSRAKQILRELGENAIEHGCRGETDQSARARCLVGLSYVRVIVEDEGPGFDVDATLESLKRNAGAAGKRGRGLILVAELADHLRHSNRGRRLEAIVRKEGVKLNIEVPSHTAYDFDGDIVIVKLSGALDSTTLPEVEKFFDGLVMEGWVRIVLDVQAVSYISSVGFGVILSLFKKLQESDGGLALAGPTDPVRHVISVLGFAGVIPVLPSVRDAIEHLG